jgi:hypothetical protein
MSAIKIEGAGAGAGTFTVVSPPTNVDRILTLPDSAGTLLNDTSFLSSDQSWTGSQRTALVVDNDGSFDLNAGNNFKCTVSSGTVTLTFTNIPNGQSGYILLINSGATIAAHANTKVDAGILATLTTAGTYLVSYLSDGTNVYIASSKVYL